MEPLHLVQEPMQQVQHRVQDSLQFHAMRGLEAHRPATYGGLGGRRQWGGLPRRAPRASTELGAPLFSGLAGGGAMDGGPHARAQHAGYVKLSRCGSHHEDEAHVLWDCPLREAARAGRRIWVMQATKQLQLGPPTR